MRIKICGITNLNDALMCEKLGADALGFIFYTKSKRFVEPEIVKEITKQLSVFTIKVGVFVNERPEIINIIAKQAGLNLIQLHGNETPELIELINLPVIKALRVDDNFDFNLLNNFKNSKILLDTYSTTDYGGTGKAFNWNIIPGEIRSKVIISGGISYENVKMLIKEINPYAIDVSSSLEELPGKKSELKVKEFFDQIKK